MTRNGICRDSFRFRPAILAALVVGSLAASPATGEPPRFPDIQSLQANVSGLLFYESAREIPPLNERAYATEFAQSAARYVSWELRIDHPDPALRLDFRVSATYMDPKGNRLTEHHIDSHIEPGWTSSMHTSGFGYDDPGQWEIGQYRVDIVIDGRPVTSDFFSIVEEVSESSESEGSSEFPDDLGKL